ncbi:hypothetical protein CLOM_g10839 [Closterium sp. NIES-68]|nr:hypothetical protein CLOM_g10839 [Closterium sp. NIES-68]
MRGTPRKPSGGAMARWWMEQGLWSRCQKGPARATPLPAASAAGCTATSPRTARSSSRSSCASAATSRATCTSTAPSGLAMTPPGMMLPGAMVGAMAGGTMPGAGDMLEASRSHTRCFGCNMPGHVLKDCPTVAGVSAAAVADEPGVTVGGRSATLPLLLMCLIVILAHGTNRHPGEMKTALSLVR